MGVDLLMLPLGGLFGVGAGTHIVVALIPPLTAIGYLWTAREVHGRVPPTAAFALPLILGYPFQFGFINHALAMALAFIAFPLWLRMGAGRARAGWFAAIALVVWTAHIVGWAVLCLCCVGTECVAARAERRSAMAAVATVTARCLPLATPLLPLLLWRGGDATGVTAGFFDWHGKFGAIESVLRDRWVRIDGDAAEVLVLLVGLGAVGLLRFERRLFAAAILLGVAFALLPTTLFGLDYADMRLAPTLLAVALLALAPRGRPRWAAPALAVAAFAFYAVRIVATTISLGTLSDGYAQQLEAVPHIPIGARVYTLIATPCPRGWSTPRLAHIGSVAIERRHAFVNDQWVEAGAQLVSVRLPIARDYASNGSQEVRLPDCKVRPEPLLANRLASFPHMAFDLVWLVAVPPRFRPRDPGLVPVWSNDVGALYRIRH